MQTAHQLANGFLALCLTLVATSSAALAQSEEQIKRMLNDLRSDRIPHNCERAVIWLMKNAEPSKAMLVDELHKTDLQGRDALFHVLFNMASFKPDDYFRRAVIRRLPERNRKVKNGEIFHLKEADEEPDYLQTSAAHWEAWRYISRHFEEFEPLLREQIGVTKDSFTLWGTAWLFKKRGVLDNYRQLYTPDVLRAVAANLKNDRENYNASQAVRLFLLLGDQSRPILEEAAKSPDSQARDLALATIDALGGSRRAFGFLNARVDLLEVLFGPRLGDPEWISESGEPFYHNEKAYTPR